MGGMDQRNGSVYPPGAAPYIEHLDGPESAQILACDEAVLFDDPRAALGFEAAVVAAAEAVAVVSGSWGLRWPRREVWGYLHARRRFAHCLFPRANHFGFPRIAWNGKIIGGDRELGWKWKPGDSSVVCKGKAGRIGNVMQEKKTTSVGEEKGR
jgi:hypothetical protein